MLKKFFNRLKKNSDSKKDEEILVNLHTVVDEVCITTEDINEVSEEIIISENETVDEIIEEENVVALVKGNIEIEEFNEVEENNELEEDVKKVLAEDNNKVKEIIEKVEEDVSEEIELELEVEEDADYIKNIKIIRGQSIRAINVYTEEELVFKTHKECSRKLKLPLGYIVENLKYGYTDYLGEAINYLSKELQSNEDFNYLESNKTPIEIFNNLHNKIFTARISESKIDEILSSEKIEPVKMHYRFECIDEEYDEYFAKYKSIIKRGGKKKIELVDKKGDVIEIFKSLDECASYLGKDKNEVVDMLKFKNTKVGRNEIRYSLRNI